MAHAHELGAVTTRQRRRSPAVRRLGDYAFVAPAIVFVALVVLYPLGYNVWLSLHDVRVGNFVGGGAPYVGLDQYRDVVDDPIFRRALLVTLLYTLGSLVGQFVIGFALALFFARPFPGNGFLRAVLLLGWILPLVVTGSVWRWMLDGSYGVVNHLLGELGITDGQVFWLTEPGTALPGVILANIWIGIPFNMVLLLAGLQALPRELYEAARVDGAGAYRRFVHITLPLLRPVILIVLLLGFIYTFRVFDLIFVMTGGGPVDATTVLAIYVYDLTFEFFRFGRGAAAATLILAIPFLLALAYLRLLRREEAA